jgi:hypothetical protein
LWESLTPEDQERYYLDLQQDANWVIWCKAKPKDIATQAFLTYGKCIFDGKQTKLKQTDDIHKESTGGKHVTKARSWWKRGDVIVCAAQTNMQCWVHQDMLINDAQVETNLREAWEHEGSKDKMNIVLQGPEQYFWKGTEAGWMGCYDFPGETWAGDGSAHKGVMGAGSVCFQRPGRNLEVRVGREEEGISSLRPELAVIARTLQAIPLETDLLYVCNSEAALSRVSRWIGSGPRTTLAGDANADIVTSIVERVRGRVLQEHVLSWLKLRHIEESLSMKKQTHRWKAHDSYHRNIDNGQHARRQ